MRSEHQHQSDSLGQTSRHQQNQQNSPGTRSLVPCPLCVGEQSTPITLRTQAPVHQNLLLATEAEALEVPRGVLDFRLCQGCGFAFNAAFDSALLNYGSSYDNTQGWSDAFRLHVEQRSQAVLSVVPRGSRIAEIGCGKGDFLRSLLRADTSLSAVGFDPSYLGSDIEEMGRLTFRRSFFGESAEGTESTETTAGTEIQADVVISRHVIEHVERPGEMLRAIQSLLAKNFEGGRVFLETPCLEWILKHQVVWDLFYEHCSLFTANSLQRALEQTGFINVEVEHVFGEQYLWATAWVPGKFSAKDTSARSLPLRARLTQQDLDKSAPLETLAARFAREELRRVTRWRRELRQRGVVGRVAVWGAGAKGTTFCQLADPQRETIAYLIDINPAKQGKFVAGTGHEILSPREGLLQRPLPRPAPPSEILVLNPNYLGEVRACVEELGLGRVQVVDFMEAVPNDETDD